MPPSPPIASWLRKPGFQKPHLQAQLIQWRCRAQGGEGGPSIAFARRGRLPACLCMQIHPFVLTRPVCDRLTGGGVAVAG